MNSATVMVVVEGPTEYTFIRDVMTQVLSAQAVHLYPVIIGVPGKKGGNVTIKRVKRDIRNLLYQRSDTYVSTMFDYSGIDSNWPGLSKVHRLLSTGTSLSPEQKGEILEEETKKVIKEAFPDIDVQDRFIPYIQMHEFEALLFSDEEILAERIGRSLQEIQQITEEFDNPEEINNNPNQSPSKRILHIAPSYKKVIMGKIITSSIGIPQIRGKCPHFDNWLKKLESLTNIC